MLVCIFSLFPLSSCLTSTFLNCIFVFSSLRFFLPLSFFLFFLSVSFWPFLSLFPALPRAFPFSHLHHRCYPPTIQCLSLLPGCRVSFTQRPSLLLHLIQSLITVVQFFILFGVFCLLLSDLLDRFFNSKEQEALCFLLLCRLRLPVVWQLPPLR